METIQGSFSSTISSTLTIGGAVIVYLVGQIFSKLTFIPATKIKRTIGEVAYAFVFYQEHSRHSGFKPDEVASFALELRRLSSDLLSRSKVPLAYKVVSIFYGLPPTNAIEEVCRSLIALSMSLQSGTLCDNDKSIELIKRHLRIQP